MCLPKSTERIHHFSVKGSLTRSLCRNWVSLRCPRRSSDSHCSGAHPWKLACISGQRMYDVPTSYWNTQGQLAQGLKPTVDGLTGTLHGQNSALHTRYDSTQWSVMKTADLQVLGACDANPYLLFSRSPGNSDCWRRPLPWCML